MRSRQGKLRDSPERAPYEWDGLMNGMACGRSRIERADEQDNKAGHEKAHGRKQTLEGFQMLPSACNPSISAEIMNGALANGDVGILPTPCLKCSLMISTPVTPLPPGPRIPSIRRRDHCIKRGRRIDKPLRASIVEVRQCAGLEFPAATPLRASGRFG